MKILASLALLAAATIGSASATVITYDTTGTSFTTIGGVVQAPGVISFTRANGASSASVFYANITAGSSFDDLAPGTVLSFGVLGDTYNATGGDITIVIPSFTLTLQFNTNVGNKTIIGSSSGGTISQNSSNVFVSFVPTSFSIGSTNYTVPVVTGIPPSTSLGGQASVQGFAVSNTVPEPGTMFLLGAGLIGVGFSARKKFLNRS